MARQPDRAATLLAHLHQVGSQTTAQLTAAGFSASMLTRMVHDGRIQRVARGVYTLPNAPFDPHMALVEACARVPQGVVCLLSALAFHGIGTQQPRKVWLGLPRGYRPPKDMPLHTISLADWALREAVETLRLQSGVARITSPPRTVVECIKHRRKVGLDTCQEALREVLARKLTTPAELDALGERFRVSGTLRPWLEALV